MLRCKVNTDSNKKKKKKNKRFTTIFSNCVRCKNRLLCSINHTDQHSDSDLSKYLAYNRK